MSRTPSSRRWLDRHFRDEYVSRAQREGYRSRAAFKLLEIQERDRFIRPRMRVVDLGAAPGGWSQVAQRLVGDGGQVVALDCLPMDPLPGVCVIQADFHEEAALTALHATLGGNPVDVVLSDMAPNLTGISDVDQPRAMVLAELALDFASFVLKPQGSLLLKAFQGQGIETLQAELKRRFVQVRHRKPRASRPESREIYLLASGFRQQSTQ